MLVIRYQGTENKADELRKFLLKTLLLPPALLQQSSTCTTSTTAPTVVLSTLNESPVTPFSQPPTPARNCTALSSTANRPPSTPGSQPPTPVVPTTPARNCTALSSTANRPPSTPASPPPTPARNCTALSSTANKPPSTPVSQPPALASHSPAVARNLSAVLSLVPNVLSSTCPSTFAGGPIHATPSRYHSTKQLVDLQLKRRSQQSSGRKFASRPLVRRVKKQNEQLKQIAQGIHHGGKEDLLAGIAHSVSCSTTKQNCSGNDWDGQLTVQEIVQLTKMVYDYKAGKTIYDTLTIDTASQIHHISSFQVLKMQDSISQKETFRNLRKQLPGFVDSERRTDQLKYKWHQEFEIVLQPSRTKTGWRLNPERLRQCVSFAYPWLQEVESEWWRLYGDARNFGGQKSVLLSLSIINNEAMFHDCSFQSPEENCWPVHIFYGSDS